MASVSDSSFWRIFSTSSVYKLCGFMTSYFRLENNNSSSEKAHQTGHQACKQCVEGRTETAMSGTESMFSATTNSVQSISGRGGLQLSPFAIDFFNTVCSPGDLTFKATRAYSG